MKQYGDFIPGSESNQPLSVICPLPVPGFYLCIPAGAAAKFLLANADFGARIIFIEADAADWPNQQPKSEIEHRHTWIFKSAASAIIKGWVYDCECGARREAHHEQDGIREVIYNPDAAEPDWEF